MADKQQLAATKFGKTLSLSPEKTASIEAALMRHLVPLENESVLVTGVMLLGLEESNPTRLIALVRYRVKDEAAYNVAIPYAFDTVFIDKLERDEVSG